MQENTIQGIDVGDIARQYGTPFYLYNGDELVQNYQRLKRSLPSFVDVLYALKVNPNVSLCALLKHHGSNAEVCSLGELEIALKAGFDPSNILFLGPSKSNQEIERALDVGVFTLVVESEEEFQRVNQIARDKGITANVSIRINPNFSTKSAPLKMGGRPTHFGIEEKRVFEIFPTLASASNINLMGIHVYNGSRILEALGVYENTQYILGLYERLTTEFNHNFSVVDVGGGMGVPYFGKEQTLDMDKFAELMIPLFEGFRENYPETRIFMESGRYIAATAGTFITQVRSIKQCHGETFLVTDGGTHCHLSAVGTGSVVQRNFPTDNITRLGANTKCTYNIAGVLCNPEDLLARRIELPESYVGDLIAIHKSGAYGPTSSPGLFHSQGHPKELLVHNQKVHVIRRQDTPEDILSRQLLIDVR